MARALRVEYPGARYHVMCRGNQSRNIFQNQEDADLFIRCLGEMCVRNQTVSGALQMGNVATVSRGVGAVGAATSGSLVELKSAMSEIKD